MSTSVTKQGILLADGESVGENLLVSSEASSTAITTNSSIGTGSFEIQGWVATLFGKTWMNNNLTPGTTYVLSYRVTCISRPDDSTATRTERRYAPILVHQGSGWGQSTTCSGEQTTDMQVGESKEYKTVFTFATITESAEYYGLCAYTMLFDYENSSSNRQYSRFRIDGLKLEEGSIATPWVPAPSDDIYTGDHGFFEGSDKGSVGKGYMEGNEFYEY